jgi:formylglycine-generating enzyme
VPLVKRPGYLAALVSVLLGACRLGDGAAGSEPGGSEPTANAGSSSPWQRPVVTPSGPKGMVWIEAGALVAGTPPEQVPRRADQEMPGEQVILDGFFIDQFAYPNEEGSIPLTNMTQSEARALCEKEGKRLCTELEWERACKGPKNLTYEYGNRYQPAICRTGEPARTLPSGLQYSCRSDFGVHDLHGGIWEWTDSPWGRGTREGWVSVRGGNELDGEVTGRCANAKYQPPAQGDRWLGFRCCQGARNAAEVTIAVTVGQALQLINIPDAKLLRSLEQRLPRPVAANMKKHGVFRMFRLWHWRPLGNEELLAVAGCAGVPPSRECGALIVRRTLGRLDVLDWVSSGQFIPTLKLKYDPRVLWIFGGDTRAHFKKAVTFEWGKISVGPVLKNVE